MGEVYKVNPEYNEERYRRKHAIRRMLILVGSILVILLIIVGLITFIVWLVLRPIHSPAWEVDDVQVVTINIQSTATRRLLANTKNWGITTYLLNADIVVKLKSSNFNKHMEVIYERIDMRVAYATAVFGSVTLPGFRQAKSNVTFVETEVKAMSVPVSFLIADALKSDIQSGSLDFEVYVDVRARVRIGGYRSFGFGVKTTCEVSTTTPSSSRPGQVMTKMCHSHRA